MFGRDGSEFWGSIPLTLTNAGVMLRRFKFIDMKKEFKFYRDRQSKVKEFFNRVAFDIYLKISGKSWNSENSEKYHVYDNYGIIDTLGWESRNGRFTFQYSDENVFLFGFKIFGFTIEFID